MARATRKWVVLGVLTVTVLVAGSTYGEERNPCEQAYLESGLTEQQMSFEEFRELYADTLCAPSSDVTPERGNRAGEADAQTPRGKW